MPKLRSILALFSLIIFAVVVAHAQGTVVTSVRVGQGSGSGSGVGVAASTGSVGGVVGSIMGFSGMNVTGAPFSADVIDESYQFLADGNRIHHETHGKTFRDSQGRARHETELGTASAGAPAFLHITIMDPVQKVVISLDPQSKTATVHPFGLMKSPLAAANQRPAGTPASPNVPGSANSGPNAATTDNARQGITPQARQQLSPERAPENLGSMEIEGFTVTGRRIIHTTPAGRIGNDKPITSTTERWTSAGLKTELLVTTRGPQGEHSRKLVNIQTGDPDPLLFQVPADYTIKETPQR
jgi:hypothetical protein